MQISYVSAPTFTRPADITAYADGDLVANSTTAGSVIPLAFVIPWKRSCIVRGFTLQKSDGTNVANADFVLHLFRSSPIVANGDNGALSTNVADKIGSIDGGLMVAYTDDGYATTFGGNFYVDAGPNRTIYGLLEADGAYTPVSAETFTATLIVEQE